jgi:hypothetical protein
LAIKQLTLNDAGLVAADNMLPVLEPSRGWPRVPGVPLGLLEGCMLALVRAHWRLGGFVRNPVDWTQSAVRIAIRVSLCEVRVAVRVECMGTSVSLVCWHADHTTMCDAYVALCGMVTGQRGWSGQVVGGAWVCTSLLPTRRRIF